MKFQKQQVLADNWQSLINTTTRYEANKGIERYQEFVDNFVMRVPLVGVFSAGKSTLLNRVLSDNLLSADIDPKTCIATELYFSENERFIGHLSNGVSKPLTKEDITDESFLADIHASTDQKGWVSAYINSPVLAKFPHVCLVDLPGLDSNLISHNQMIDDYIQRSLAYCIVVSIEDGELKASTQKFLTELKINQMPVLLIITKSDRKPPEDVEAISQKITQSITQLLGREPIKVVTVSARKKTNIDELINAFIAIEERAEQRFDDVVVKPLVNELNFLVQNLDKRISAENLTLEQLNLEKSQLNRDMENFRNTLDEETRELERQSGKIINNIGEMVRSRLISQTDNLAENLLNGIDIKFSIENTVRTAISQGIQSELIPTIQRYVQDIQDDIPINLQIQNPDLVLTNDDNNFDVGGLVATFTPLLGLFKINPIVTAISVAIPIVTNLLNLFITESNKKRQEAERQEKARQKIIHEIIPSVQSEVNSSLNNTVKNAIQQAKQQIAIQVEQRNQQVQAQLQELEQTIIKTQEEQETAKQIYLSDKDMLQNIIQQIA